ncbi:MAG: hypothetical protein AAF585_19430, partial [Verrucomicrobiota bacterium]
MSLKLGVERDTGTMWKARRIPHQQLPTHEFHISATQESGYALEIGEVSAATGYSEPMSEGKNVNEKGRIKGSPIFWAALALLGILLVSILIFLRTENKDPLHGAETDLYTRTYRVMPDFYSSNQEGFAPADPFAGLDSSSELKALKTTREILEDNGIVLPPGGSVLYSSKGSQIVIRADQKTLDQLEDFLESQAEYYYKCLQIRVRIFEAPTDLCQQLLNETQGRPDHTDELILMENWTQDGKATLDTVLLTETTKGRRSVARSQSTEVAITDYGVNEDGMIGPYFEQFQIGTSFEADPHFHDRTEEITISFGLTHDTAPPTFVKSSMKVGDQVHEISAPKLHRVEFHSTAKLQSGSSRLIGIAPVTGDESRAGNSVRAVAAGMAYVFALIGAVAAVLVMLTSPASAQRGIK